jgi:hypothetical protein
MQIHLFVLACTNDYGLWRINDCCAELLENSVEDPVFISNTTAYRKIGGRGDWKVIDLTSGKVVVKSGDPLTSYLWR